MTEIPADARPEEPSRRKFLKTAGVAAAAVGGVAALKTLRGEAGRKPVALLKCDSYDADLRRFVDDGLAAVGVTKAMVRAKPVVIKPNLVEPHADASHINVHPHLIGAVAESFRAMGASDVLVAEGAGHVHDSYQVLHASGLVDVLAESRTKFMDLNYAEARGCANAFRATEMKSLYLPKPVLESGVFVSLAKMKTHHWAGATLSMKNLFGIMPGSFYGWPKNVLHMNGIDQSIMDINSTILSERTGRPHISIVDGIIGMEGDGPIMGTPKPAGVLAFGTNPAATDAVCARVMGINPFWIRHMREASKVGSVDGRRIAMRGESIADVATTFELLPHIPVHKMLLQYGRV